MTEPSAVPGQGLVEAILAIGRLQRTGILTIQNDLEIVGISFLHGEIVSADALNQSLEEGLGELLAERGLVKPEEMASLAAEYQAGGGRVLELLVERNYVGRTELLEALRGNNYRLCRQALAWKQCEFKFYAGEDVSCEKGVRSLPVEELLVRAAEELGARGPFPGQMPSAEAVYRRASSSQTSAGMDELLIGLETESNVGAASLLDHVDGRSSAGEIADKVGISIYQARLNLYLLLRAARIEPVDRDTAEFAPSQSEGKSRSETAAAAGVGTAAAHWWSAVSRQGVKRRSLDAVLESWRHLPPRFLGAALTVALLLVVVLEPGRMMLPFPWQEGLRQAILDEQTSAAYLKIDRAAQTAFLLEGQFPESLEALAANGYLLERDLIDPAGRRLGYAAQVAGYLIYPLHQGEPAPRSSRTETITGNFLLDPEFATPATVDLPPLILLD